MVPRFSLPPRAPLAPQTVRQQTQAPAARTAQAGGYLQVAFVSPWDVSAWGVMPRKDRAAGLATELRAKPEGADNMQAELRT